MSLQDVRQTAEYAEFMQLQGWQVGKIQNSQFFYKKLWFLPWSIGKLLRAKQITNLQILELKKAYNLLLFVQEPFIKNPKFIQNIVSLPILNLKNRLTPSKTLWLDLRLSIKTLKQNLKARTRYNLKRGDNKFKLETQIIAGDKLSLQNIQDFYNLWSKNKPYSWLFRPSFHELSNLIKAFAHKCFIVYVYTQDYGMRKLVAVELILTSKNMAFYWHNASSDLGKQVYAPTKAIWQAILESKKRNLEVFDFEGIWDQRMPKINRGWQGFSRFKLSFIK